MATNNENKILYKELSYKLQGLFFDIRNDLSSGHKESIYQKAFEHLLVENEIMFKKEPAIKIYSAKNEFLGLYRPDFLIEDKIIIEFKAAAFVTRQENTRIYDYLRNSKFELAYLVNFASKKLYIKRFIFTNDKKFNIKKFVAISILFVAISGLGGLPAKAAKLELVSPSSEINVGQKFQIDLTLDAEGQDINAVEGEIFFTANLLGLKEIRYGDSIINFWIKQPHYISGASSDISGQLVFSGIIPGGFRGVLSPYYKGDKPGKVLSVIFIAKKEGNSAVEVRGAKVLLNNGKGTTAKTTISNFQFLISKQAPIFQAPIAQTKDTNPPELFTPEISRDPNIFDGQWFLVFAAQDKISGVDRYEVAEKRGNLTRNYAELSWQTSESPYLLKDQNLRSYIYVKAVDKSGNVRIVYLPPKASLYEKLFVYIVLGLGVIIVLLLINGLRKLWRKKIKYGY